MAKIIIRTPKNKPIPKQIEVRREKKINKFTKPKKSNWLT